MPKLYPKEEHHAKKWLVDNYHTGLHLGAQCAPRGAHFLENIC